MILFYFVLVPLIIAVSLPLLVCTLQGSEALIYLILNPIC